ncbi:MAG: GDP-mannose pyrophosphatase NudK [Bacteroidetes bacterium]|nr:GDP-mannose pyrophosphatase NudK [Bacteroidota bacterium]
MQNDRIKNMRTDMLSGNWYKLYKVTFDYLKQNGQWQTHSREAYDRGNGAAILLYHKSAQTVILTQQFRLPTFINGNNNGMLVEVCAGLLDKDNPEDCIKRETEEETGYTITEVQKVFEAYMSPGSVTEKLYFFIAAYDHSMKTQAGGGVADEQEDIELLELPFKEAVAMMESGIIEDAKTIMLLQYLQLHPVW